MKSKYKKYLIFKICLFLNFIISYSQVIPYNFITNYNTFTSSIHQEASFNLSNSGSAIKSNFNWNFSSFDPYTIQFIFKRNSNTHTYDQGFIGFTSLGDRLEKPSILFYEWDLDDGTIKNYIGINYLNSKIIEQGSDPINKALKLNVAYHITTTYDGINWKNYRNGILINTTMNNARWSGSGNLIIGNRGGETNMTFDEVRFWNRALTADEISINWNKSLSGYEEGLMVYYNFDHQGYPNFDNSKLTSIKDVSLYNNNGIFINTNLTGNDNNFVPTTTNALTHSGYLNYPIFNFDAINLDSYPGTGKNNNGTQINSFSSGKIYNLNGFNNNLQFYNNSNYNNITSLLFYKDGGRSFGGRNIFGKSNYNSDITGASPLTIEAWVKFNSLNNTSFISLGENLDGKQFELALFNSRLFFNPGGIYNDILFSQIIDINKWYYVVCTYNGRSNYIIYINGVTDQSKQFNNPNWVTQNTTNTPIYIGKNQSSFNGKIGFLKIYNRSLNFLEVSKRYDASKSRFGY